MRYVLDTNTCIYALKLQGRVVRKKIHVQRDLQPQPPMLAQLLGRQVQRHSTCAVPYSLKRRDKKKAVRE